MQYLNNCESDPEEQKQPIEAKKQALAIIGSDDDSDEHNTDDLGADESVARNKTNMLTVPKLIKSDEEQL